MHLEIKEISRPNKLPLEFKGVRVTIARIRKTEFSRETGTEKERKNSKSGKKEKKNRKRGKKNGRRDKIVKDTTCRT